MGKGGQTTETQVCLPVCLSIYFIYSWVREINIIYMSGLNLKHTIYIPLYGSLSNKNIHSGLILYLFLPHMHNWNMNMKKSW